MTVISPRLSARGGHRQARVAKGVFGPGEYGGVGAQRGWEWCEQIPDPNCLAPFSCVGIATALHGGEDIEAVVTLMAQVFWKLHLLLFVAFDHEYRFSAERAI